MNTDRPASELGGAEPTLRGVDLDRVDHEALEIERDAREAPRDSDWLSFHGPYLDVPPGTTARFIAQPRDVFRARTLAVAVPQEPARHLVLTARVGHALVLERVCAEAFVVRIPEDRELPVERGARIRGTWLYAPIPMILDVENGCDCYVRFRAVLLGREARRP